MTQGVTATSKKTSDVVGVAGHFARAEEEICDRERRERGCGGARLPEGKLQGGAMSRGQNGCVVVVRFDDNITGQLAALCAFLQAQAQRLRPKWRYPHCADSE